MQQNNHPMTAQEAFSRLSALCARSEHCSHDLTEKMRRWQLSDADQTEVMERLTSGRYVDDSRYALAFVKEKVRFNKWGRRKVEQALRMKHIDDSIIAAALHDVADEDYVDQLRSLLRQKRRSVKADSSYELNRKLTAFALQRGFTFDIIKQCIDDTGDDWPAMD